MTHANSRKCNIAIVAEGGGQRGIFTAGVLDTFLQHGFNPFSIGIGVSAGAQNLLAYFLSQQGYAHRAISELTMAPGFYVPYRWFGQRGVLDLDSYFEKSVVDANYRLPYQVVCELQKHKRLLFVATDKSSMQPVYLEPDRRNVIDHLKASSAVPFLYKARVEINGVQCVDGGVSDPLPIARALEADAEVIVVIRTVPMKQQQSGWRQGLEALLLKNRLSLPLVEMLEAHEQAYAESVKLLEKPPAGVRVFTVAPDQWLQSNAFGSSSTAIANDYQTGRHAGRSALKMLRSLQREKTEASRSTEKARKMEDTAIS